MRTFYKSIAIILLLFNGAGAIYGGYHLMLHPDGSSIQLSSEWIENTAFKNYFIPGLVLFIANGLFSFVALAAILFNTKNYYWFVIIQGSILFGWIIIQILLIQTIYYLHFLLGGVGIALILVGFLLKKMSKT